MNGEGSILPVPQLSTLCRGSPALKLLLRLLLPLVVLIQTHSYTDYNYADMKETLCYFAATHLEHTAWHWTHWRGGKKWPRGPLWYKIKAS